MPTYAFNIKIVNIEKNNASNGEDQLEKRRQIRIYRNFRVHSRILLSSENSTHIFRDSTTRKCTVGPPHWILGLASEIQGSRVLRCQKLYSQCSYICQLCAGWIQSQQRIFTPSQEDHFVFFFFFLGIIL